MSTLLSAKLKQLKAQAHALVPVIIIGNKGLTKNIILETDRALMAHELIKIRVNAANREARQKMAETLCNECQAEFIQMIGHIAIIYRKNPTL